MPPNLVFQVHILVNLVEAFGSSTMRSTDGILQCPEIVARTKNGIDTFVVALSRSPIKRTEPPFNTPQCRIALDHLLRSRHEVLFLSLVIYFKSGRFELEPQRAHIFEHPPGGTAKTGMGVEHCEDHMLLSFCATAQSQGKSRDKKCSWYGSTQVVVRPNPWV